MIARILPVVLVALVAGVSSFVRQHQPAPAVAAQEPRTAAVVASASYRYDAPPSISRAAYSAIVCAAGPACDEAGEMYDVLVDAGIDPVIEAAQAMHETGLGTTGVGQPAYKNLHGVQCHGSDGRIADSKVKWGNGCAGVYASYTDSVRTWANVINREYIALGLNTPALAVSKYAPVSDGNDPPAYVADMERHIDQWRGEETQAVFLPAPGKKCPYTDTMQVGEDSDFYSKTSPFWSGQYDGMHLGADLVGNAGDPVYAPFDMQIDGDPVGVTYTGEAGYTGWRIQAHFDDGVLFYAGHLIDVYVQPGQRVAACTPIGTLGATAGPHVHIKLGGVNAPVPCEGSPPGDGGCLDPMEYWNSH